MHAQLHTTNIPLIPAVGLVISHRIGAANAATGASARISLFPAAGSKARKTPYGETGRRR
jgi:hypothetical protein